MKRQLALAAVLGLMAASNAQAALPGQPDAAATLPGLAITIDVLANDGLTGPVLSKALTKPTHGTARWVGTQILYTPANGFHGTDFFRYSAITRSGRAANQKVTISVDAANGLNLTLSGRAKAGVPLANATVTADVGALHYSTQTDGQGNYSLPVLGLNDSMVSLRAQGSGAQAAIVLKSTLGELARLGSEAGDGVLTRDEDNQVQLTELSTALAYTLEYANGGVPAADDVTIELASRGIDQSYLTPAVSAIRYVATGEYPLPEGVSDTDALIRDKDALNGFFQPVFADDFENYYRTAVDAMQDPDVVLPSVSSDFVGTANLVFEFGNPGTISASYYQGTKLRNDADGTGSYVMNLPIGDDATHWMASGTGIGISHDHPYTFDSFPYINGAQVRERFTLPRYDLVRAARIGGRLIEGVVSHATYTYPENPEIPSHEVHSPGFSFVAPAPLPFTAAELTAAPRAFKVLSTGEMYEPYGARLFSFNPNGTGTSSDGRHVTTTFAWSIDPAGSLVVAYPNGDSATYARLDGDGSYGEGVMAEFHSADGINASYGMAVVSDMAGPFTPGQLAYSWESGLDLASTHVFDNDGTYYLKLDGAAQTGTRLVMQSGSTFNHPLSWVIDGGTMYATEFHDNSGYVARCQIGANGCVALYARRWTPVARSGNRTYVLEELYLDNDGDGHVTDDECYTQRIMFYETGSP